MLVDHSFKKRKNELDVACFQLDMAYGDFKDLIRRTVSDKVICDKAFNIAKNSKYDKWQGRLASMVYNFVNKESLGGAVKSKIMSNQPLAEKWHVPII